VSAGAYVDAPQYIRKFDQHGKFITQYGPTKDFVIKAFTIDHHDQLQLATSVGILVVSPAGKVVRGIENPEISWSSVAEIACDTADRVYLAHGLWPDPEIMLHRLDAQGKILDAWRTPQNIQSIYALTLGRDGMVYVLGNTTDSGYAISKFSNSGEFISNWRVKEGYYLEDSLVTDAHGNIVYNTRDGFVTYSPQGTQLGQVKANYGALGLTPSGDLLASGFYNGTANLYSQAAALLPLTVDRSKLPAGTTAVTFQIHDQDGPELAPLQGTLKVVNNQMIP